MDNASLLIVLGFIVVLAAMTLAHKEAQLKIAMEHGYIEQVEKGFVVWTKSK